jgi:hypothetical protein
MPSRPRLALAVLAVLAVLFGVPAAIALLTGADKGVVKGFTPAEAEDVIAGCIRITREAAHGLG